MKQRLIAGAFALSVGGQAVAADLPSPMAPKAPAAYVPTTAVPVYNCSGVYLGINGGYAVAQSVWADPAVFAGTGPFSMDGVQIGGTIGANYQWGHFVLGIEGDGDWTKQKGTISRSDWLATVRGRAGYAFDRILLYGTGGAAPANRQVSAGGPTPSAARPKLAGPQAPALKWPYCRTGLPRSSISTSILATKLRVASLPVALRLPR
jgi:outer membrane immunogenic protein